VIDGLNTFTAVATDASGNQAASTVTVNLPASVGFVYDANGNLTSDGLRAFDYDDENQLIRVTVTNQWKSEFAYDGKMRRRIRNEYTWTNSAWLKTNEVHYIYDGNCVIQERNSNNVPQVTYTRGLDLSGSFEGAGGIGGLLARTAGASDASAAYYASDANGNVIGLFNANGTPLAQYNYDPFGNLLSKFGVLADANVYRFSSKEWHENSGLVYYLYRYYEPNLQRWVNRDPIGELGGINLYSLSNNDPVDKYDRYGLMPQILIGAGAGCAGGAVGSLIGSWISGDNAKTAMCEAGISCAAGAGMGAIATMVPWAGSCLVGAGQAIADGLGGAFCDRKCSNSPRKPNTCYAVGAAASAVTGCIMGKLPADAYGHELIKILVDTLYSSLGGTLGTEGCDAMNNFPVIGPRLTW
jgi:RHS repeat-associated protein